MTFSSSAWVRLALVSLVGFVVVQACGGAAADRAPANGSGGFGGAVGSGGVGGSNVFNPDVSVPPLEGGMPGINALCGVESASSCTPDDERACGDYVPPTGQRVELLPLGGAGGDGGNAGGGVGGAAGEQGAGGAGGASGAGANAGGNSGAGGTESAGADGGAGGVPGPPAYACRVVHAKGESVSECAATGRGALNAPCFTGADCGASLACVADGPVSRCRPYCCGGDSSCARGSYCAERQLQDVSILPAAGRVWVPVCVAAENCELSEPFPCPAERVCQCSEGNACMVVRPDGTTACTAPGAGKLGEACPCAHGFVCSQGTATATCVKLCATVGDGDAGVACPSGKCQASAELPAGWGVCVGG